MTDLLAYQYVLIALIFIWSGFVRSGLGFGGAALSLPFLLLVTNQPLVFLPIVAIQLLFFSSLTLYTSRRGSASGLAQQIDWPYFKKAMIILIIPKLIGVFGLLTLSNEIMSIIIFLIVGFYAVTYLLNKTIKSNPKLDVLFLALGGYMSGTSLIGAPLIIAVVTNHVAKEQLRNTLFALWFVLVWIKMAAFIWVGVDLQLIHQLWLLPAAGIGHWIGLKAHDYLLRTDSSKFYRVMGAVLLFISTLGVIRTFW